MVSRKIGIHAPYTWDESTQMACALGDLAVQFALKVSYLSMQSHDNGVHFRWDNKARSGKKQDFKHWARNCSVIVWFDVHKKKLELAVEAGCTNVLVPLWHRITSDKLKLFHKFNTIICPSSASHALFQARHAFQDIRLAQWDAGLRLQKRPRGLVDDSKIKLYVSIDGATVTSMGSQLFAALTLLIDSHFHLHVTIGHTRQWSRTALGLAKDLVKGSNDRVVLLRNPSHSKRLEVLGNHDWVFCPTLTPNSGVEALEALAMGVPVIAFDIAPMSEFIQRNYNGVVVRCDKKDDAFGVPAGEPNSRELFEALEQVIGDEQYLFRMQANPWPDLESRSRAFQQVWRQVWQ